MAEDNIILSGQHLTVGYQSAGEKNILLDNISLKAEKNELISLIGLNGSGKSTLLRSILKLENLLGGEIFLFQKKIEEYSSAELARKVAFVSTDWMENLNMKVHELVALGRYPYTNIFGVLADYDRKMIQDAIQRMKLEKLANKKIAEISDGEKQRAMIARAIAQDTDLILLDEPTAFLDILNKYEIVSYLRKLCNEGKTIIISSHDFHLASRFSDRYWLIDNINLIDGMPEDLILEGAFQNAFTSPNLIFDFNTGDFMSAEIPVQKIGLRFPDALNKYVFWTRRALERNGYASVDYAENTNPCITIMKEKGQIIWNLHYENENLLFKSLFALIKTLKKLSHESG